MNVLLDKFENIKVDNKTRLSEDDYNFCEYVQALHEKVIDQLKNSYETILELKKQEKSFYNEIKKENENLNFGTRFFDLNKERFAKIIEVEQCKLNTKIVSYFKDKYKVKLEPKEIDYFSKIEQTKEKEGQYGFFRNLTDEKKVEIKKEKEQYKKEMQDYFQKCIDYNLHYNVILDDLFYQLGGLTFRQKSDQQTKTILQEYSKWVKLNKSKVTIEKFFYIDSFDANYKNYNVSYNSDGDFYKLFIVLSHFCYGSKDFVNNHLYDLITRGKNEEIFKIHEVNNTVKLKLFKNGKIELMFEKPEFAERFAKEYCGYIEQE